MEGEEGKETVCVTGGTGYVASWLIKRLLQHGYSVHTTIRSHPDNKKDVSYLTSLPGAKERLRIFDADLNQPESFEEPISGCVGVFHVSHPVDYEGKEPEEVQTARAISGTLGILKASLGSKTVKRVVYTSSTSAVLFNGKALDVVDEETWSDVDFIKANFGGLGASYFISKTLTEKAALEFAKEHGLDLVTVLPTFIHGPFLTPRCPGSVRTAMAMIFGYKNEFSVLTRTSFVHIDDVASAHIFLFEHPNSEGRYNCSAVDITIDGLYKLLTARYPEYHIPVVDFAKTIEGPPSPTVSSKKLLAAGFGYKYGLEKMYDGAIECCKQRGLL